MQSETVVSGRNPRWMFWTGWVLSAIPILMMGAGGVMTVFNPAQMNEGLKTMGYPSHVGKVILILEIAFVILYALPQTAVLGAILITAYLGGAVATHVRVEDGFWPFAIIVGVITWLGLFFRDARVRALVPLRRL